ncbi:hypothetical protein [Limosilactobacillus mucosae]|uniref:hypothetical protein n=1 Tax=Limosilactobacillus mucosae TaxID=97478 RepID=UPI0022E92175|nr:hypothetical protein [Limosilactobacillus mucosae]
MTNDDNTRAHYLKQFKRQNPVSDVFGEIAKSTGNKIVELMKKEDLTYDEAYGSLQYAYNKIKYESNFLKLQ